MNYSRRSLLKLGSAAAMSVGAGQLLFSSTLFAGTKPGNFFNMPEGSIENARKVIKTPDSISTDGRLNLGIFEKPVRDMNLDESELFGGGLKAKSRRARMQEFIGWGLTNPEWHIGVIIIDIQLIYTAAFYVLNRKTGVCHQYEYFGAGNNFRLAKSVWDDKSFAKKKGFDLEFTHGLEKGVHKIKFACDGNKKKPPINLEMSFYQDLDKIKPLAVSLPVGQRHYFYTHKSPGPIEGEMKIGKETVKFHADRDSGTMDEHRNYYPLPNQWAFGCFSGFDKKGRLISVNMCDNVIEDQKTWNENCFWAGNEISYLGPISFEFDRKNPQKPWKMKDDEGRLNLVMTPDGGNKPIVIPPAGFSYYQKCGSFKGTIIDDSGIEHNIDGALGETEKFELGIFI
jgi:Domain of unknown function (DUF2804), C-terminal/Domain of unknown function (DUF2804), N-terminal